MSPVNKSKVAVARNNLLKMCRCAGRETLFGEPIQLAHMQMYIQYANNDYLHIADVAYSIADVYWINYSIIWCYPTAESYLILTRLLFDPCWFQIKRDGYSFMTKIWPVCGLWFCFFQMMELINIANVYFARHNMRVILRLTFTILCFHACGYRDPSDVWISYFIFIYLFRPASINDLLILKNTFKCVA